MELNQEQLETYRQLIYYCLHQCNEKKGLINRAIDEDLAVAYYFHPVLNIILKGTHDDYCSSLATVIDFNPSNQPFNIKLDPPVYSDHRIREGATIQCFKSECYDYGFYQVTVFHKGCCYQWMCTDKGKNQFLKYLLKTEQKCSMR